MNLSRGQVVYLKPYHCLLDLVQAHGMNKDTYEQYDNKKLYVTVYNDKDFCITSSSYIYSISAIDRNRKGI